MWKMEMENFPFSIWKIFQMCKKLVQIHSKKKWKIFQMENGK